MPPSLDSKERTSRIDAELRPKAEASTSMTPRVKWAPTSSSSNTFLAWTDPAVHTIRRVLGRRRGHDAAWSTGREPRHDAGLQRVLAQPLLLPTPRMTRDRIPV